MLGEALGKTKDQLRREIWMMKLRQIRNHIPAVVGIVGTIVATAVAMHYKNELQKIGDRDWSSIPLPPEVMMAIESGETMLYRHIRVSDSDVYAQYCTNRSEFTDDANKRYNEMKEKHGHA